MSVFEHTYVLLHMEQGQPPPGANEYERALLGVLEQRQKMRYLVRYVLARGSDAELTMVLRWAAGLDPTALTTTKFNRKRWG